MTFEGPSQWSAAGQALASFLLVLCVAAVARSRRPALLERAVDATLQRPLRAPLYGVAVAVVGAVVAAYAVKQMGRLGGGVGLATAAAAVGVGGAIVAGGFGFVVVGAGMATVLGARRPWTGPLLGAGVSAIVLVALPIPVGTVVWALVAATGLGGSARRWVHASKSVEKAE